MSGRRESECERKESECEETGKKDKRTSLNRTGVHETKVALLTRKEEKPGAVARMPRTKRVSQRVTPAPHGWAMPGKGWRYFE